MQNAPSTWRVVAVGGRVAHADAAVRLLDRLHARPERDVPRPLPPAPSDDAVGAADDLEHRRLHVDFGREVLAEARAQQFVERQRIADDAGGGADAGRRDCSRGAATRRSAVSGSRPPSRRSHSSIRSRSSAVIGRSRASLRDRLGEKLRRLAAPVGAHLAQAQPLAERDGGRLVDVGRLVDAAERLDRDAELAAIVERRRVVMRNARGAGVEIQVRIERRLLRRRADLLAGLTAPHGEARPPKRERASRISHS